MKKSKRLHVRDARDDEREAIRDVTLAAYEEYAAVMPKPFWQEYRRQLLVTIDEEGPVERIVAERNGTIIGSDQDSASLNQLAFLRLGGGLFLS